MNKNDKKPNDPNRAIRVMIVILSAIFAGMLVYFLWFMCFGRQKVISRADNNRFEHQSENVIRGEIRTSDGVVIAKTVAGENREEDTREYPYGSLFAAVTGYSAMGRTGLEASMNSVLLTAVKNPLNLIVNDLTGVGFTGNSVVTTIDSDLQYFCYQLLGERKGSITVMEPRSGKILAMVSRPTIDPNTVAEDWNELTDPDNDTGCLLNRCTQGLYPPGSTFKIITAIEYMKEHPESYKDFRFVCTGSYTDRDGHTVQCDSGTAHGEQTLKEAIAHSCNCAFVCLSESIDKKNTRRLCEKLGFNRTLIDELPSQKSVVSFDSETSDFEFAQSAFGQGKTLETPLQNLLITCFAANGGTVIRPQIVEAIEESDGSRKNMTESVRGEKLLTEDQAAYLNESLIAVVNEGTTPQAASIYCQTAGKSGSAQYSSGLDNLHAWFTGYAPAENPEIAVTVMLEKGGHGSPDAAPLFSQIVDYYFERKSSNAQ